MTKCTCGYEKFFNDFAKRLDTALKPAVKLWQKETKQPYAFPDTVSLVKWMVGKIKEGK